MNRPYIFCHMMTALDGKIMGSYMETPQGSAAGDVFYDIAFGKEPFYHHQGWLSGRVTTDDNFTFYKKPDLDENAPAVPAGDFIAQPDFGKLHLLRRIDRTRFLCSFVIPALVVYHFHGVL